jgi:Xaa-Pro aminopeptidase
MKEENLDGLLITRPENRRYTSGFTGSSGHVLLTADRNLFITDFRYKSQAAAQCEGFEILLHNREKKVVDLINDLKLARLGFEDGFMTVKEHKAYTDDLEATELVPIGEVVEKIRQIKSEEEIEAIRTAASIADRAFDHVLTMIKPGVTEREVALALEMQMKKLGATKLSFESIVASGKRGALPHGIASDKAIESGELVTLDFGCVYEGYCSDMTRTIAVGEVSDEMRKIYHTVLEAQEAALEAIRAGVTSESVDKVARDIIEKAGHGDHFGHGLGHAVGLEVHESPRLAPGAQDELAVGMVVTNEPGIYVPDLGGVRIEDLVLVTEEGCEILSRSPKELIVL